MSANDIAHEPIELRGINRAALLVLGMISGRMRDLQLASLVNFRCTGHSDIASCGVAPWMFEPMNRACVEPPTRSRPISTVSNREKAFVDDRN